MDLFKVFSLKPSAIPPDKTGFGEDPKATFMTLAVELRLKIYASLIADAPAFFLHPSLVPIGLDEDDCNRHAMLWVNRTIHAVYKDELLRTGHIGIDLGAKSKSDESDDEMDTEPRVRLTKFLPHNVLRCGRRSNLHLGNAGQYGIIPEITARLIRRLRSLEEIHITIHRLDLPKVLRSDDMGKQVLRALWASKSLRKITFLRYDYRLIWFTAELEKDMEEYRWTGKGSHRESSVPGLSKGTIYPEILDAQVQLLVLCMNWKEDEGTSVKAAGE